VAEEVVGEPLLAVELLRERSNAIERELPHRVAQQLVLGSQIEVHGRRLLSAVGNGTLLPVNANDHTVESVVAEIGRMVAERQELRAAGASPSLLEQNRRLLADAQARLSHLLIARHRHESAAASSLLARGRR